MLRPRPQLSLPSQTLVHRIITTPPRHLSSTSSPSPHLSPGQDENAIIRKLTALLLPHDASGARKPRWDLVLEGKGLRRSFHFRTFGLTWAFMQGVAGQCRAQRHHPEWWNLYNDAIIQWTTHKPEGLSGKDVDMAAFCDEQARLHGEEIKVGADGDVSLCGHGVAR